MYLCANIAWLNYFLINSVSCICELELSDEKLFPYEISLLFGSYKQSTNSFPMLFMTRVCSELI